VTTDPGARDRQASGQRADGHDEAEAIWGRLAPVIRSWRRWRHSRPFWGGLFVLLGGSVILLSERTPLPLIVHIGIQGLGGYLVPAVLVLCGLLLWFNPGQRVFYSLLSVLLALSSWITSNLGGFFIGMLLGVLGGSLAFAWQPRDSTPSRDATPAPPTTQPSRPAAGLSLIIGDTQSEPDPQSPASTRPLQPPDQRDSGETGSEQARRTPFVERLQMRRHDAPISYRPAILPALSLAIAMLGGVLGPGSPQPQGPSQAGGPPARAPVAKPPAVAAASTPSRLTAVSALLTGLSFDGVAAVRTRDGRVPMLKFSMNELILSGGELRTRAIAGSSPLIRESLASIVGHVILYTTRWSYESRGKTITFTPRRPPATLPRNVTYANLTTGRLYLTSDELRSGWSEAPSAL
jgi:hypothetical protein